MANILSSSGFTSLFSIFLARSMPSSRCASCAGDGSQITSCGFPPATPGSLRSRSAVLTMSVTSPNRLQSSGRFTKFANRVRIRKPVPEGLTSIVCVILPKTLAQLSKYSMPSCWRVRYCKRYCQTNISDIALLIGVPVIRQTPPPLFISCIYLIFSSRSNAR